MGTGTHKDLDNNYRYLSVQAYTSSSAIAEIDYINVTFTESSENLIEKYSPVLFFYPQEKYYPMNISSLMDFSDLKSVEDSSFLDPKPTYVSELVDNNMKLFMDNPDVDVTKSYSFPDPSDFNIYPYTVYARKVTNQNNYTALQYYFFYPHNFWNNNHEGDWEMIQVILDENNEFESASHNFHFLTGDVDYKEQMEWYDNTHPVVMIGQGSHASYFNWTPYGEATFIVRLLNNLLEIESLSKDGKILHHGSINFNSPEACNYNIELIDDSLTWINFPGHWGEIPQTFHPLFFQKNFEFIGSVGPRGPKYMKYYFLFDRWQNPFVLATKPKTKLLAGFLKSPADIHVYDSLGNHVGSSGLLIDREIPGLYFYTGQISEPEAFMLFGEDNYTIELWGNAQGLIDFVLFYYDPEKGGLVIEYNDIEFTETTIGIINVNSESNFEMLIDNNNDGTPDDEIFPDNSEEYEPPPDIIPEFSIIGALIILLVLFLLKQRKTK
jgi:hypothetical protein